MISCWQTINAKELRPVKMDVKRDVKWEDVRNNVRQGKSNPFKFHF